MSHTVAIKTEMNNWELLQKSFSKLGWAIKQKAKIRTYPYDPGRNTVYDYIAINPVNGYDVGITMEENKEGETQISLHYDPYDGSVERSLGTKFAKLKKEYVLEVAEQNFEEVLILEMFQDGSLIVEADDGL